MLQRFETNLAPQYKVTIEGLKEVTDADAKQTLSELFVTLCSMIDFYQERREALIWFLHHISAALSVITLQTQAMLDEAIDNEKDEGGDKK